ncbi:uncharacterized protein BXZ73DRAFT_105400 [Epithele typhae]|uniref:uncharacterized protein n=1 Tax=Epithele typhae TaxID=378194 RepID=UPI00200798E2|nr:uncharacterized protein BXZ73DRAFT_105400 [Epithele typhae]KAH9917877.1 hypothetical protein BXZ73DRAFT_105400 [Epithele typhae]
MATASTSEDWEGLSRRLANYMYRSRVDGSLLQDTPVERDKAIAELNNTHQTAPFNPQASVDAEGGLNVDQYLAKVDEAISELDDKEKNNGDAFTIADRVLRLYCLFSAALFCSQYKCPTAQLDFDANGMGNVSLRALRMSQEMFNESSPRRVDLERSPTDLSNEAITALLEDPAELVKQRFLWLSEDEDEAGQWSVESTVHTRRGIEYVIVYDDADGPIPMDKESMRDRTPFVTRSTPGSGINKDEGE